SPFKAQGKLFRDWLGAPDGQAAEPGTGSACRIARDIAACKGSAEATDSILRGQVGIPALPARRFGGQHPQTGDELSVPGLGLDARPTPVAACSQAFSLDRRIPGEPNPTVMAERQVQRSNQVRFNRERAAERVRVENTQRAPRCLVLIRACLEQYSARALGQ